jgi:hypothetical protein
MRGINSDSNNSCFLFSGSQIMIIWYGDRFKNQHPASCGVAGSGHNSNIGGIGLHRPGQGAECEAHHCRSDARVPPGMAHHLPW